MQDPLAPPDATELNSRRLDAALKRFRSHPIIHQFREFLTHASDDDLFHIDLDQVGRSWGVKRRTVLEVFLRAVRFGILSMEWVFHCPTCGGAAKESLSVAHTHEQEFCPVCRVDFRNTLDQNVEVFFSVSAEIRPLPPALKEEYVRRMMSDIATWGRHEWRTPATVRGVEVLNHPVFRDIFGNDTLSLDQSLEISSATVLFTDVTGSTALYEALGDARAYRLIRDHFDAVFSAITVHEGVPIKTIGDAVMGVFAYEAAAVRAAFAMSDALATSDARRGDGYDLRLKVGIHRGPVIVVTLNNRLDYFGRTVNIASRVQSLSGPNEVSMVKSVLQAPGVKRALRERISKVARVRAQLKGIDGSVEVYRAKLTPNT
jgi:class 3 adenylate cyclase